jgi:hypothetical protein
LNQFSAHLLKYMKKQGTPAAGSGSGEKGEGKGGGAAADAPPATGASGAPAATFKPSDAKAPKQITQASDEKQVVMVSQMVCMSKASSRGRGNALVLARAIPVVVAWWAGKRKRRKRTIWLQR